MRSERILIVLGLAGFLACARGSGDLDGIDPYTDDPIDGVTNPDGGSTSLDGGGGGDGGSGSDGSVTPTGDAFPIGAISFFDRVCPTGWTSYGTLVGRTIVPTNGGSTLVTVGDPLTSGQNPSHNHSVYFSFDLGEKRYALVNGGANGGLGQRQTIVLTGNSANASTTTPYVQMMACRKTATPIAGTIPVGLTSYFETAGCPTGWSNLFSSAGRIIVGTPNGAPNDQSFGGASLSSGESRTHTHAASGSWSAVPHGIAGLDGTWSDGHASVGPYAYNITSGVADTTPPYLTLTHCRKQ